MKRGGLLTEKIQQIGSKLGLHTLVTPPGTLSGPKLRFGFTRDMKNYTHSTGTLDDQRREIWAVVPLPDSWRVYGRPARRGGETGLLGRHFYPLRVLHGLK